METAAPSPPVQARSRATRRRLLEATIEALVEGGYARTTTPEVCRRAGVSQGALFKHFGSKAELLGAAVRHLFADLIAGYGRGFAALADAPDRVGAALRLLVETFREPRLLAAFELYTVARTDPVLRAQLVPVMDEHRRNLRAAARALLPETEASPEVEGLVDAAIAAVQGAALTALVLPEGERGEAMLSVLERWVRREVEPCPS